MSRTIDGDTSTSSPSPSPSTSTPRTSKSRATSLSSSSCQSRRAKTSSTKTSKRRRSRSIPTLTPNYKLLDCVLQDDLCYCVCLTDKELHRLTGKRLRHYSKKKQTFKLANCGPRYQGEVIECYARVGVLDDTRWQSSYRVPRYRTYTNPAFPANTDRPKYLVIARLPTQALGIIGGQQAGMDVETRMVQDMEAAGSAKTLEKLAEIIVEARKACAAIIDRWPQDQTPVNFFQLQ